MQGQDEKKSKVLGQGQSYSNKGHCESQVHLRMRIGFRVKFSVRVSVRIYVRDLVRNRVGSR